LASFGMRAGPHEVRPAHCAVLRVFPVVAARRVVAVVVAEEPAVAELREPAAWCRSARVLAAVPVAPAAMGAPVALGVLGAWAGGVVWQGQRVRAGGVG
jgi:uncharacterized protein YcfJ